MTTTSIGAGGLLAGFWGGLYLIAATLFAIFDLFLLIIAIYAFIKGLDFRPPFAPLWGARKPVSRTRTLQKEIFIEQWRPIAARGASGTTDGLRAAIIEADAFVDAVFKQLGVPGEHFSDRFGNVNTDNIRSADNLWRAHRTRNSIVHTPGYTLTPKEMAVILRYYEEFLVEIGILPPPTL